MAVGRIRNGTIRMGGRMTIVREEPASPDGSIEPGRRVVLSGTVTSLTTAQNCIGATEGWLDISDGEKGISIVTDKALCYSVFLLHYEEKGDRYFLRAAASIGEHDSTGAGFWKGYYDFAAAFVGHVGKCPPDGVRAAGMNHKLLAKFCPERGR